MIIGLDYDKTADEDLDLWALFARQATDRGHQIYVITMREESNPVELPEMLEDAVIAVIYTDHKAKAKYCEDYYDLEIDVWIEDSPKKIYMDYEEATKNEHG